MRIVRLKIIMLAAGLMGMIPVWVHAHDLVGYCMDCHGKDGASTEPDIPIIGGLSRQYLINSLSAYWEGARPCPDSKFRAGDTGRERTNMCQIAKDLTTRDVERIASYYSSKPFVRARQQADPAKAAAGELIHQAHCESCHAGGGSEAKDDAGILAGQWMEYLRVIFQDYKEGTRVMPAQMEPKIESLGADDIEALVHYYGSQGPN